MDIGETLVSARQRAGLSVGQVSDVTRIRSTVIRAIERDDFSPSGGDFYARGHIRAIAHTVGTDDAPLIQAYDDAHGGAPQPTSAVEAFEPETPLRMGERRRPNWSAAMVIALLVIAAFVVVRLAGGGDTDPAKRRAIAPPSAGVSPTSVGPSTASPSPTDGHGPVALAPEHVKVRLRATESTWVSVRDDDGKELFEGLVHNDKTKSWTARKKIRLTLGNAGGVKLTVNGTDVGKPGKEGDVVRLSFGPGDPTAA